MEVKRSLRMDEKMIEEGLKRIRRNVEKEELEKATAAQEEEKAAHEADLAVLTDEEERLQNEKMKQMYPEDVCPVCGVHVVDARYLVDTNLSAVTCGNCHVLFMPNSRYELAVGMLKTMQQKKTSQPQHIVVPKVVPIMRKNK